ncbi:MAG: aspartate aminotransferase family protein [Rhodospirillales bacterium]|nr:aspartate aminotransferase family protein [Rhodospirillales bacterium]
MTITPNSAAARDLKNLLHPVTNLAVHQQKGPIVMERGDGVFVYDETGKEYLEGLSGLWCTALGFSENELIEAAIDQMRKLPTYHGFGGRATPPIIDLAEKLIDFVPFDVTRAFFVNSGSEANDTQVKLMWQYFNAIGKPEKKKIISREKAYHGSTVAAASLTGLPAFQQDFDLPIHNILHTDCPNYYRNAEPGESEEEYATRLAGNLEKMIEREGADTVAAFIAEPVMGAGGVLMPPATYFEKIQKVLKENEILFIADEVICGFARTGNMFGCETYDIKPDTVSLAKQLSSAYLPIAAVLIPEYMFDVLVEQSKKIGVFGHGMTYGVHPVPAAVALKTLEIYEERDILGQVRKVSPRFQKRIDQLADHPLVGNTRSVGLLGAVEMMADKKTKRPFEATHGVGARVLAEAEAEGLIIRPLGDTIGICPPLIISESEIDELFDRLTRALDSTEVAVNKENLRAA